MSAGGRGDTREQGLRRCAHAALPAQSFTSSARCSSAQPPPLAHGNHSNPTVPAAALPCQPQNISNTQSAGSFKTCTGLQVGDKSPLSPPSPACARVGYLLDENLERNKGKQEFSIPVGVRSAATDARKACSAPGRVSISPPSSGVRQPCSAAPGWAFGQQSLGNGIRVGAELKEGNSQGRKYHKALIPTVYKFQLNICRVWVV